jgi:hypothetical protein
MVDAVTTGTPASFSYRPPQSNTAIQYYSAPFAIGRVPQPWTLVVGVSRNTIMTLVRQLFGVCVIIGALALLFTCMLWIPSRHYGKKLCLAVSSKDDKVRDRRDVF